MQWLQVICITVFTKFPELTYRSFEHFFWFWSLKETTPAPSGSSTPRTGKKQQDKKRKTTNQTITEEESTAKKGRIGQERGRKSKKKSKKHSEMKSITFSSKCAQSSQNGPELSPFSFLLVWGKQSALKKSLRWSASLTCLLKPVYSPGNMSVNASTCIKNIKIYV